MALASNLVKQRVEGPEKKQTIAKAVNHEERLKFHAESYLYPSGISKPLTQFLDWVRELLPKDKFSIFVSLFKLPVLTVDLTETIFNELERVFDGRNAAVNYQFESPDLLDDWEEYRTEKLKEPSVWREKAWDQIKSGINSVIVIDLPREQLDMRPEPYFYFLDIRNVIDYSFRNDRIEWIIFKCREGEITVIDDEHYQVFTLDGNGQVAGEAILEEAHELGYCPAQFLWSDSLTKEEPDLKKSPLSAQLSNLDWLLFYSISKRHLDLYAPYPIYSAYEADCDFQNNETGDYCDGGYLRGDDDNYKVLRDGGVMQCPVCAEKRLAGVGAFIEVPAPQSKEDPDLRNPVSITQIDKASLEYNVEEVTRLGDHIFNSVVGVGGDVTAKKAVNEKQVIANYESRSTIINALKQNIEKARRFTAETICRLRYGNEFNSASINLGTEFYIYTIDDLYEQYKAAKANGSSEAELDQINSQILETEYRNNPNLMQRMLVLKHLEPYRHYTLEELMKMGEKNWIDPLLLQIKINFNRFVDKFERENMNVVEFGSQIEFNKKIENITNTFIDYVKQEQKQRGQLDQGE